MDALTILKAPARLVAEGPRVSSRAWSRDPLWFACSLLAAAMAGVAGLLPLWRMELLAPQYPAGLHLWAYGTRMEGDLREINALNHYVGIAAIHPEDLIELRLFPFLLAGLVLALLAGAVIAKRRWQRLLLVAAVWAFPVGMLLDLQWWLYRYGHDLDPAAALRLDPFTPKVVGTTKVMNFHTEAMVGTGFWVFAAAGALLLLGPALIRFVRDSWQNTGAPAAAAALVALAAGGLVLGAPSHAEAATLTSITQAIEAARPGDTVVIPAGVYQEQLVIDRPIVLVGEGAPVIDGGGLGDVVRIEADDVTLRGFVVRHSARIVTGEPSGIRVTGHRATLEGNRLEDVLYGIALQNSNGHVVRDNSIASVREIAPERRGHALYVWNSADNLLQGNRIQHAKDGIFLGFALNARLIDNVVTQVRYGVHTMYAEELEMRGNVFRDNVAGASLMYSRGLLAVGNEFSGNRSRASGYGLLFKDMDDVLLLENRIFGNRLGLTMDGAPRTPGSHVTLERNLIGFNQVALELFRTVDATFVENSFVGNLQQVESRGGSLLDRNRWSLDGRGNYWDDYQGFDADGDGVGDVSYRYEGAYDDLVRREEALRAYAHTPARMALDQASRWFPVYRSEPRVVDEHPLVSPAITLRSATSGSPDAAGVIASTTLIALAAATLVVARRARTKAWTTC